MTTIHDVARLAGVSPVTVSRVINGASNVNAATREKVESAIKELSYVPNQAARSLRSRQTSTLALIVPDITNSFWTTVARGVEDAARSEGFLVWLCNSDENQDKQNGYINAVLQQRVDGVMIAPYDADPENLHQLRKLNTPTVVLDRDVHGWDGDMVRCDSISGAYALVQHLISLGHRRIAMVSGPSVTSTAEERIAGYCLALEDAGIEVDPRLILRGEYRARSGHLLTDKLLTEDLQPSAIFAANNVIATGVLESLQEHGKRVPEDIALVCFDELPDLARIYPFLTVTVQPAYDMGVNAAQLLLSRINAEVPLQPRHVVLPSRLVLRHSCGRFLQQPEIPPVHPLPLKDISEVRLIKPLTHLDEARIKIYAPGLRVLSPVPAARISVADQPDVHRLHDALNHLIPDRLPHVETQISSKAVLEYVLERSLPYRAADLKEGKQTVPATDYVEFAQRLGIDAIPCEINGLEDLLPKAGRQTSFEDHLRAFSAPSLTEQFTKLEGYLRAAQASSVGIFVSFHGPFSTAIRAIGKPAAQSADGQLISRKNDLERWLDLLCNYQEKVIRTVCDRFSKDLAFVIIHDPFLSELGTEAQPAYLKDMLFSRLGRMISPAREHSIRVGIEMAGNVQPMLADLQPIGFELIHAVDPERNDLASLLDVWQGKLAVSGGFPVEALLSSTPEAVEDRVRVYCQNLANRPGLVFGVSPAVTAEVKPELYLAMVRAVRKYGKYERVR